MYQGFYRCGHSAVVVGDLMAPDRVGSRFTSAPWCIHPSNYPFQPTHKHRTVSACLPRGIVKLQSPTPKTRVPNTQQVLMLRSVLLEPCSCDAAQSKVP